MVSIKDVESIIKKVFREFEYSELIAVLNEYNKRFVNDPSFSIETTPSSAFTFPASDISRLKIKDSKIELEARFLSLIGVTSPLQYDLVSNVTSENIGEPLHFLLNLFNSRIYKLFNEAVERHHLSASLGKLTPLESETNSFFNFKYDADYSGSLALKGRGGEGLETLLKRWFSLDCVEVIEFTGEWVKVDYRTSLNGDVALGRGALLGEKIFSPASAFRVIIYEVSRTKFESKKFRENIKNAIIGYISDPLDFEIILKLKKNASVNLCLSENNQPGLGFGLRLGDKSDSDVEIGKIWSID